MIMKKLLLVGAALTIAASSVWADGRHHRGANVGIYVGPGFFWGAPVYRPYRPYYPGPYYYPAPYYEPAPVIVQSPPVYIEQSTVITEQQQETPSNNYWYFCRDSNTYYPYVKACKGEWEKVLPQPEK